MVEGSAEEEKRRREKSLDDVNELLGGVDDPRDVCSGEHSVPALRQLPPRHLLAGDHDHGDLGSSVTVTLHHIIISAANRLIGRNVQSRRRPLLGPSRG